MSPFSLRRYRAERLLREEFEHLSASVIAIVRSRLRAVGVSLDSSDLEACYAQAWQGLYAAVLGGQQVADAAGWLVLVTYRRAIDEHRARTRGRCEDSSSRFADGADSRGDRAAAGPDVSSFGGERDLAAELDDRATLRQFFEALRGRLSAREQQAATLCYLQGLSRSEAAARMGVSETRMRKLMEGRGAGSPGVAGKVGALVETIRAGAWCEEQGSLMRGFAYGILDPAGERYRLALAHRSECPACRAYVLSLRGLAAILPPVPWLLRLTLGAGAGSGAIASSGVGAGSTTGAAAPAGSGVGGATLSASGAAGTSTLGGGWLLAGGPLGAKLAVGCLLIAGVGASCVALDVNAGPTPPRAHDHRLARSGTARAQAGEHQAPATPRPYLAGAGAASDAAGSPMRPPSLAHPRRGTPASDPAVRASREFGPEQGGADAGGASSASGSEGAPSASVASAGHEDGASAAKPAGQRSAASSAAAGGASHAIPAAQREFAPG